MGKTSSSIKLLKIYQLPKVLPVSNEYGNYFLTDDPNGPVIFPAKASKYAPPDTFIASRGYDKGFYFDGPKLVYFKSASEALQKLRKDQDGLQ